MKALVLAGGRGSRLGHLTDGVAKPMLPIGGRPFLTYLLDRLIDGGVEALVVSLHYRALSVSAHFGSSYRGVPIRYEIESAPLGTGGAIAYALRNEAADPCLVVNGDTLLGIDYAALLRWYARRPDQIALVARPIADRGRYSSVVVEGETVTGFTEKGGSGPALINAGSYVLRPSVFGDYGLAGSFSFESDLLRPHCAALRPRAYVSDAYFVDIGVPADLERAQRELPMPAGNT